MIKQSRIKVGCPFCYEWLPDPELRFDVYSGEGARGGRCECGAFFVVDETGKAGGQALMDVRVLAAGGDLEKAMQLDSEKDFELKTKVIKPSSRRYADRIPGHAYMQPKVWAIRLKNREG